MKYTQWIWLLAGAGLGIVIGVGATAHYCSTELAVMNRELASARTRLKEIEELTPETARRALIEMVERAREKEVYLWDYLMKMLPQLKTDPIDNETADKVNIGGWSCNLARRTWSVHLD